jgi:hypothetical protein
MSDEIVAPEAQTPQPVSLQLSDILNAVQIMQLATQRGAFKTEEFTQIGGVYDRLVAFLRDSGAIKPSEPTEAEAPVQPEGNQND